MKYVSIDIETTGLNSEKHQVLEFAAILEDTNNLLPFEEIPKFSCIIEHSEIIGQPIAINMNQRIMKILSDYWMAKGDDRLKLKEKFNIIYQEELASKFIYWLAPFFSTKNNSYAGLELYSYKFNFNIAGKNYASFDEKFLNKMAGWNELVKNNRRIIDPSILYTNFATDDVLPSLDKCLELASINKCVTHTAIEDAWDVIQVLRKKY